MFLAHLADFRLEPRKYGDSGAWAGGDGSLPAMHASLGPPTDRPTDRQLCKAGSDQTRMPCTTRFERKT